MATALYTGDLLLAVEGASPSSQRLDFHVKRQLYLREGVEEYWVVDPAARNVLRWRGRSDPGEILSERVEWQPGGASEPLLPHRAPTVRTVPQRPAGVRRAYRPPAAPAAIAISTETIAPSTAPHTCIDASSSGVSTRPGGAVTSDAAGGDESRKATVCPIIASRRPAKKPARQPATPNRAASAPAVANRRMFTSRWTTVTTDSALGTMTIAIIAAMETTAAATPA